MNDIKRIFRDTTRGPSYFFVDWMLHDKCTYNCSYCPPFNKIGSDNRLDLSRLLEFCDSLEGHVNAIDSGNPIHCLFTGGEPTVWKNFGDLVDKLSERNWFISVNTNGSRSLNWWKDYANKFSNIFMSYHTEYADDLDFLEKANLCSTFSRTSINIMLNPDPLYFDRALNIGTEILKNPNISLAYHKIQHTFGGQYIDVPRYTTEQLEIISKLNSHHSPATYSNIVLDNMSIEYNSGEITYVNGPQLIATNRANFNGWSCSAGLDSIFIDSYGEINLATCRVNGSIGNILYPDKIQWNTKPVICPFSWCGCISDILISKQQ